VGKFHGPLTTAEESHVDFVIELHSSAGMSLRDAVIAMVWALDVARRKEREAAEAERKATDKAASVVLPFRPRYKG
jgi:hypothetical protein